MTGRLVVVVGTGTGVGKTHVALALMHALAERGLAVAGYKAVETGLEGGAESDASRLSGGGRFHVKPSPYRFAPSVSPHLAARQAGTRIDLGTLRSDVAALRAEYAWVVVESAGGLFTPLGEGLTNWDLVRALDPCGVVLVARDGLGVLHDLTATLGLAAARGRRIDVVALSAPEVADASTGTNAGEAERLGIATVTAVFPRSVPDAPASTSAARNVLAALG